MTFMLFILLDYYISSTVSRMIIENANTVISAQRLINEYGDNTHSVTPLISFMNGKNE